MLEGTSATVTLDTDGCSPAFDIDRGALGAIGASLRITGLPAPIATTRLEAEQFSADVPGTLTPGLHPFSLVLDDGRSAASNSPLEVVPLEPAVTTIESSHVALSFGEREIPLSITVTNRSACAVHDLDIRPTFRQLNHPLSLATRGPGLASIAGGATSTLEYEVDLDDPSVQEGPLYVSARSFGGARTGAEGCTGDTQLAIEAPDLVWTVVASSHQVLDVTQFTVRNMVGHNRYMFDVRIHNGGSVDLTIDSVSVSSVPPGFTGTAGLLSGRNAMVGDNRYNSVAVDAPVVTMSTPFDVSFAVTARDSAGMLYSSTMSASPATVTVDPQ